MYSLFYGTAGKGALKYVGPLTVAIQELDGTFNHTFKIEENKTKFEITCHSKSRRQKNKKIPLCTGITTFVKYRPIM